MERKGKGRCEEARRKQRHRSLQKDVSVRDVKSSSSYFGNHYIRKQRKHLFLTDDNSAKTTTTNKDIWSKVLRWLFSPNIHKKLLDKRLKYKDIHHVSRLTGRIAPHADYCKFSRGRYLLFAASSICGFATFPPSEMFKMGNVMNLMCSPDQTNRHKQVD